MGIATRVQHFRHTLQVGRRNHLSNNCRAIAVAARPLCATRSLFVVGGHGPMQDLAVHPTISDLLAANLDDATKIVGAVCHGPAAFLPAHRADGTWLFAGRRLTSFTNEEETAATLAGNAPWLLEDRLRLAGARFEAAAAWTSHVVVDGNLVTGQQNASSGAAASKIMEQLGRRTSNVA